MNILIVAPEYPPRSIGGGGVVYQNLSKELKNSGHGVKVMAGSFSNKKLVGQVESVSDSGVPVFFIPLMPSPKFKGFDIATYTLPALSGFSFVTKQLLRNKNTVIHLQGLCHPMVDLAAFACMIMRKQYVLTCHGIPKSLEAAGFPWRVLFKIYLSTIEKTVFGKARAVTVVSHALMKECHQKNLVNKHMTVVPNGPNQALVKANPKSVESIEKRYSLKGKRVIFAIGRLNPTKGFQYLVEAMQNVTKQLPDAAAVIAGSGPYKKDLQDLISRKGLADHVKLIGRVSEEEKAAFYERCDVVAFPSLQEPFGIVILEAFTMNKPVVAFGTDSALEIIEDETDGLLVPIGDKDKLAEGIVRILTDKALTQKIAANTQSKVATFGWKNIADKYMKIYCETQPLASLGTNEKPITTFQPLRWLRGRFSSNLSADAKFKASADF
jgi:glycogen(starch) synthase